VHERQNFQNGPFDRQEYTGNKIDRADDPSCGPQDFEVAHVDSVLEATTYLAEKSVDVVLLDLESDGVDGKEELRRMRQAAPRVSIVIPSSLAGELMARQAMRDGAQDYLIKGEMQSRELVRALENAIERKAIDESLFEEKERAQVTLASIGDAVISADPEGRITFLNRMAERMTGWSQPEARAGGWMTSSALRMRRRGRPSRIR
jgi:DNA-binding response OmpR family regulator